MPSGKTFNLVKNKTSAKPWKKDILCPFLFSWLLLLLCYCLVGFAFFFFLLSYEARKDISTILTCTARQQSQTLGFYYCKSRGMGLTDSPAVRLFSNTFSRLLFSVVNSALATNNDFCSLKMSHIFLACSLCTLFSSAHISRWLEPHCDFLSGLN